MNLDIGLDTTSDDSKIVLNSGSNFDLRANWTTDGDVMLGKLKHLNSDAVVKLIFRDYTS